MVTVSLPGGAGWKFTSTPSPAGWVCTLTSTTKLTCTSSKAGPIAKGTNLGSIHVPVSVPAGARAGSFAATAVLSDTGDGATTVSATAAVTVS
jgi:hypothetical protein